MADLSEQSPNVAKQDSSTKGKVVSTPHSELSTVGCSLRETSCLERKGYLSQPDVSDDLNVIRVSVARHAHEVGYQVPI